MGKIVELVHRKMITQELYLSVSFSGRRSVVGGGGGVSGESGNGSLCLAVPNVAFVDDGVFPMTPRKTMQLELAMVVAVSINTAVFRAHGLRLNLKIGKTEAMIDFADTCTRETQRTFFAPSPQASLSPSYAW